MLRFFPIAAFLAFAFALQGSDDPVVFKSDVAMTRVDAQVVDSDGRVITGLEKSDFVLRLDGKTVPIRNFASENLPIDILLLLDVSGSMQPHVQRIAYAAQQALNVLAPHDRVAIMVFDTRTRLKLPFTSNHTDVTSALDRILRFESFHGGTFITGAMISAADYVQHQARPDARRAVVILTDDETQDSEDEPRVEHALARANAMLSFLQAPYEPPTMNPGGGRRRGTWGGGWPGGGGIGFPGGGGVGLPGGGRMGGGDPSHSAGTSDISTDTGGDTMRVDDASALQDTFSRLRQRYALYFYLPEGAKDTDQRNIQVDLGQEARIRYSQAEIRYRHSSMSSNGASSASAGPTLVTHAPTTSAAGTDDSEPSLSNSTPTGRRVMVNEDSSPRVNLNTDTDDSSQPSTSTSASKQPTSGTQTAQPGWPRANPPNSPPQ